MKYSYRSRLGYAHLYKPYNDITVFVEDTTCRNMYEYLINRMLRGLGHVTRVIQLGNKAKVIEVCRNRQSSGRRAELFIIDGDLDLLRDRRRPRLRRLYKLSVYSIENALLDEDAYVDVLAETMANTSRQRIRAIIQYWEVVSEVNDILLQLFILYAVVFRINLDMQTVSYSIHRLSVPDAQGVVRVSRYLVRQRMRYIIQEIYRRRGRAEYLAERKAVRARVRRYGLRGLRVVSGKDYIFPLLMSRAARLAGYKNNADALKVALAKVCDLNVETGLGRALRRECR